MDYSTLFSIFFIILSKKKNILYFLVKIYTGEFVKLLLLPGSAQCNGINLEIRSKE